jgi:hypothetical protein
VLALYAVVGPVAYKGHGERGLAAAALAAIVCLTSATLALLVIGSFRDLFKRPDGMLVAMAVRMVLPFAAGVCLERSGGWLSQAGVFGYIVIFYLATLFVETLLSLSVLAKADDRKGSLTNG